jgi:hypothetical protein
MRVSLARHSFVDIDCRGEAQPHVVLMYGLPMDPESKKRGFLDPNRD